MSLTELEADIFTGTLIYLFLIFVGALVWFVVRAMWPGD